jgi:hypothetical protein
MVAVDFCVLDTGDVTDGDLDGDLDPVNDWDPENVLVWDAY